MSTTPTSQDSKAARRDEICATEFFQKHYALALEAYQLQQSDNFASTTRANIWSCESPLEAAFLAWLPIIYNEDIKCRAQYRVEVDGRDYRVDLFFEPSPDGCIAELRSSSQCPKVAVELDGHEFHERTKEQVIERNQRDRALQAAGWNVLHISGSEFNAKPETTVRQVMNQILDLFYAADHARKTAR